DLDELTATFLRCPAAAVANRDCDLVARATRILRALKGLTAEQQHGCVVIERPTRIATDFRHRFPKRGEHLPRELEAKHLAFELGVRKIVGKASRTMPADEVLDLTHGAPASGF